MNVVVIVQPLQRLQVYHSQRCAIIVSTQRCFYLLFKVDAIDGIVSHHIAAVSVLLSPQQIAVAHHHNGNDDAYHHQRHYEPQIPVVFVRKYRVEQALIPFGQTVRHPLPRRRFHLNQFARIAKVGVIPQRIQHGRVGFKRIYSHSATHYLLAHFLFTGRLFFIKLRDDIGSSIFCRGGAIKVLHSVLHRHALHLIGSTAIAERKSYKRQRRHQQQAKAEQ